MNAPLYIEILLAHGEYVAKLTAELSTTLRALEDLFSNQAHNPDARRVHSKKIEELQRLLATETDMLCRRLKGFIEETITLSTAEAPVAEESPPSEDMASSDRSATNKTE